MDLRRVLVAVSFVAACSSNNGAGSAPESGDDADPADTSGESDSSSPAPDSTPTDSVAPPDAPSCVASGACTATSECCSGTECIFGKCRACSGAYPKYCPRPGRKDGGCFAADADCSTVTDCPDGSSRACNSAVLKYDCSTKTCVCPDPKYPKFCKGHDAVPDACWTSNSDCSTTTTCGSDLVACTSPVLKFDCATKTCGCPDPKYPVYCKARDTIPEACWGSGAVCSTTTKCADGSLHACRSASFTYDCSTGKCTCADPKYPVYCPALGDVPENCWTPGTLCSSVANCSGTYHSCTSAGYHYDCAKSSCVPDSTGGGGGGGSTSCNPASCKSYTTCVGAYGCMTCYQWCEGSVCHDGGCSDPF